MQKFCACGAISSYIQLHPAVSRRVCIFAAMFTAGKMAKVCHALGLKMAKVGHGLGLKMAKVRSSLR